MSIAVDRANEVVESVNRLAEIKAKRAELHAQNEAIKAEAAAATELAKAELDLANETALVAAALKYGPIGAKWSAVMTRLGVILLKAPGDVKYKAFQEDPKYDFDSLEAYAAPCVIHPSQAEFAKIYKELPGILGEIVLHLNALMGERKAEQAKK